MNNLMKRVFASMMALSMVTGTVLSQPITVTPNKPIYPNATSTYYPLAGILMLSWVTVPGADEYGICRKVDENWQLYRTLSADTESFECRVDTSTKKNRVCGDRKGERQVGDREY
ncbi:hypothetical protein SAMN02910447_03622 [Ruminococcus sp. YE71]|uniref:hypothetical protein n=1 Tax=unclassified Ruminococcus TaxID=2608920 RepID=UPI000890D44F|nr:MULTISPECIES: hypothetical protein [unclassified Ruminococcus]SDA33114.1 hypothetical protein SAMN02910446_03722 [Ruminococcus sp. YE78]SFW54528.1 hypothetical protein SAMN02910447_03622 [Ruminococcus sp. YE71]